LNGNLAALVRLLLFAAVTLPLMPVQWLLLCCWPTMARRFPQAYHRLLCFILGFEVSLIGDIPRQGPCLVVANHVSWIDIVVMGSILCGQA
jgi:lyso-ornithine lipid O-acyltransferase